MILISMANPLALVTGAASGLGREFSRLLAKDSYDLILVDMDQEGLEQVQEALQGSYGITAGIVVKDLGKPKAAEALYEVIGKRNLDILINNAGFGLYGLFSGTDWELEESMLNLHVMSVTRLSKIAVQGMLARGSGRILNVSSLAAFQPGPLMSVYYASKAYILSFTEALASELKGTGVTATVLLPGWFRTNFQKSTARNSNVEESRAKLHTATAGKVAKKAYRAMMAGRVVVVPGLTNKLMAFAPRVLPRSWMRAVIRHIQERLRK